MSNPVKARARYALRLLEPWGAGDTDEYAETMRQLQEQSAQLVATIDAQDGDARGVMVDLEEELRHLADLAEGALRIARDSIDLAVTAGGYATREAALADLGLSYSSSTD